MGGDLAGLTQNFVLFQSRIVLIFVDGTKCAALKLYQNVTLSPGVPERNGRTAPPQGTVGAALWVPEWGSHTKSTNMAETHRFGTLYNISKHLVHFGCDLKILIFSTFRLPKVPP